MVRSESKNGHQNGMSFEEIELHVHNMLIILGLIVTTLFRSITMLCGTDSVLWNIPHIQTECEVYSMEYC